MIKIRLLELFGGIGACTCALKRLGIDFEVVDYVEIDKYAVKSYNAINETNFEPQDICNWNKDIGVDLIMHGSPCQDFSLAGKQAGGDKDSGTRSSLMYETIRIVGKLKPKYVIWENVKNILSKKHRHNFDNYLEKMKGLGYTNYYQVLNAKDYGIPQNRERVFVVSILENVDYEFPKQTNNSCEVINPLKDISGKSWQFEQNVYSENSILRSLKAGGGSGNIPKIIEHYEFPSRQELKLKLKDVLEDEVEEKYYINDGVMNSIVSNNQAGYLSGGKWDKINESCRRYYKISGISPTIHTCQGGNTELKIIINKRIRKLTPKECWRLMGFNDEDFDKASEVCSNTQLYKQAGNSICVPVLIDIFKNLLSEAVHE